MHIFFYLKSSLLKVSLILEERDFFVAESQNLCLSFLACAVLYLFINMSQPQKRSIVWVHFTPIEGTEKAQCNICRTTYSFKGGATCNLRKHLHSRHPTVLLEEPEQKVHRTSQQPAESRSVSLQGNFFNFIAFSNIRLKPVDIVLLK